jgi:LmbE family N-acetylglucosaminyl deacetylase
MKHLVLYLGLSIMIAAYVSPNASADAAPSKSALPSTGQPLSQSAPSSLSVLTSSTLPSGNLPPSKVAPFLSPKILIIVAHPDDEYYFAGTVYRLVKEKGAEVEELVITNGEGGYRYSGPAEKIYHLNLHEEAVGRAELPKIREKEIEAGGKILGIEHHFYLSQKDFGFTLDPEEAFKKWDRALILKKITEQLKLGKYQFVFVLAPIPSTHGHHKAASLLALEAIASLPEKERPVALAGMTDRLDDHFVDADHKTEATEGRAFLGLVHYPSTKIDPSSPVFHFNRARPFDPTHKLTYQVVVNWMIAEHKSQGMFQTFMNRDDDERFRVFLSAGADGVKQASELFTWLNPAL